MKSRHSDWHNTLNCAILPKITGVAPSAKLDISNWNLPKDIKLADEHFYVPGGIDLLIGADIFYEILQAGRRKRQGDFPVLQETTLGWIISGRTPAVTLDPQHTFMLQRDNSLKQQGRKPHCQPPPPAVKKKASNPRTRVTCDKGVKPSTVPQPTSRRRAPQVRSWNTPRGLQQRATLKQTTWRSDSIPADSEVWLNSKPLCTQSNDPSKQGHMSPRHIPVGEQLTQPPLVDNPNVNATNGLGVKPNNNNSSSSDDTSQLTTSRAHNSQPLQSTSVKLPPDDLKWLREYNAAFYQPYSIMVQQYHANRMATSMSTPDTKESSNTWTTMESK
jgi:hypothetical protein